MNLQEAKIAANKGEQITHQYFSSNEFVTVKDGKLLDENGYHLNWAEFWEIRSSANWQDGWEIFKPKEGK